jgi:putative membrane-bound dehydrogenase-like protein
MGFRNLGAAIVLLFLLAGFLFQPMPAFAQAKQMEPKAKSPQASLKCIKTRPGFTVELMAAEPLVMDPIAFAWGPDGKLWVVEMGDYPLGVDGKGKAGGKIKFLESTKGDGKYDKATVFKDNLPFPTGVLPWGKGVLVTCAPDIFYAEDTTGSGKADLKKVLYTGFNKGNQQHRVNSLAWGLDGWIYVANGDSGGVVKSVKTGQTVNIGGRDLRIKPDEGLIEAQTGQTQYGRSKDDWDNWFGNNNSNPMFHFVLADHYLKRNPHFAAPLPRVQVSVKPGSAPVFPISPPMPRFNSPESLNHFTSACSAIVYRDELFGPAFAGNSFVSEPVHNLIHREIMKPKGVTFTSSRADDEQQSEFLASTDNWFRPTMLQTGPDGALWVADMYRYVIEHPEWIPLDWQKKLDLRAGHDMGRIYRIFPTDKKPRAIPRLDKLDSPGLVAALDSPSGWQRDMAQMLLMQRQEFAAVPLLEEMALKSKRPLARVHALCTLDGLGKLKPPVLQKALMDMHPGLRNQAVRLCEPFLADSMNLGHKLNRETLGQELLKLVNDSDIHVRMQLAYTLGEWHDAKAGTALGQLATKDGRDHYFLAAVMSSVTKDNLDPMLLTVLKAKTDVATAGPLVQSLLEIAQRQGNSKAMASLLAAIAVPEQDTFAHWQFTALGGLLDSLAASKSSLAELQSSSDPALKKSIGQLAALFDAARTLASNPKAPQVERLAAIKLLGRGLDRQKEDLQILAKLLVPQTAGAVQQAAVAGLGKLRHDEVPPLLLKGWKSHSPVLRKQVLDALLVRSDGVEATVGALEKKQILAAEVDLVHQQQLLQHQSTVIRAKAAKLFATALDPDREKVFKAYLPALTLKGDAGRGKLIFEKNCSACHFLGGIGKKVGPDLAALTGKSGDYLLRAILDPNAAVEARYVNYTAMTRAGLNFNGMLVSETATSITLVGADGKEQVILRTDLDELFSTGRSVMPDGLEKDISKPQMADLLTFLKANLPTVKRKEFAGNNPQVIQPTKNGTLLLPATTAEIYGPSLVFEGKHKNLGYWSSTDDHAVWTVEVKQAGKYSVWFDWAMVPGSAGNTFVLDAGSEKLTGKVVSTGNWDNYQQAKVGMLPLSAGQVRITLRPHGKVNGALIDLRSIKLVPIAP